MPPTAGGCIPLPFGLSQILALAVGARAESVSAEVQLQETAQSSLSSGTSSMEERAAGRSWLVGKEDGKHVGPSAACSQDRSPHNLEKTPLVNPHTHKQEKC